MNILDIIGPVMVGPSSSHTAGAVRIGLVAGKLLAEPIKEAQILLGDWKRPWHRSCNCRRTFGTCSR